MALFGKSDQDLPGFEPEKPKKGPGPFAWLRARFFAGIIIAAPIAITLGIVFWAITEIDRRFKPLIPDQFNPDNWIPIPGFGIPGLGLIFAVIIITLIGAIGTNLIGRSIVKLGDRLLSNIPIVRNIYSLFKQLFEVFGSSQQNSFKEMVLVEYPKIGTWCVGFVSGTAKGEIGAKLPEGMLGVFVPTTPNPTSGFFMFAPEKEVIRLDMTVEEGAKLIVSVGMVVPEYVNPDVLQAAIADHEAARADEGAAEEDGAQAAANQTASGA